MNKQKRRIPFQKRSAGFTLVELIVVLIILGILAALLLPTLSGYIGKAHETAVIANGREAATAAQSLGNEAYAKGAEVPTEAEVLALAGLTGGKVTAMSFTAGRLDTTAEKPFSYTEGELTATLIDGVWSIGARSGGAGGGTGGDTPAAGITGFTVSGDNVPAALSAFFAAGWEPSEYDGVAYTAKTFTGSDGEDYIMILSQGDLDIGNLKKEYPKSTNVVICDQGKISHGNANIDALRAAGALGDGEDYNPISFSGSAMTITMR